MPPVAGLYAAILPLVAYALVGSSRQLVIGPDASVPFRGYWFWIDDRDIPSKRLSTFLMFIFTLLETGGKEGAPIVTIPAG